MTNEERYIAIAAELLLNHPVTGLPYDADDTTAKNQLNEVNIEGDSNPVDLLRYLILNRYRSNAGTDLTATSLYGRIVHLAGSVAGDDTFGSGTLVTMEQIHSAMSFISGAESAVGSGNAVTMGSTDMQAMLNDMVQAEVFGPADRTAIKAMGDNKQSRGTQIKVGRVKLGDIQNARNI